jgi:hypothetical protein
MLPEEVPAGGIVLDQIEERWDAWRPDEAADRLRPVSAPWCVAGGWALDLWRGEQTREHSDLEIALPAWAFGQVRSALAGYVFETVGWGRVWPIDSPAFDATHQAWVSEPDSRRPGGRAYRLDVFREPASAGNWACRRDEQITLPYDRVIGHDAVGIPYLNPEIVLLFKAKHARPKDQVDFDSALPLLRPPAAAWLRAAMERVHPGHQWIKSL